VSNGGALGWIELGVTGVTLEQAVLFLPEGSPSASLAHAGSSSLS